MHVVSHGIDLVRCDRIADLCDQHGELFLARIFTAAERAYCLGTKVEIERLSGRFAAKEAVLKALGTGWRGGIRWTDVETLADEQGKPHVTLHGEAARIAAAQGITRVLVSISHTKEHACASAIAVGDPPTGG